MSARTALVAGATGLVGRALLQLLLADPAYGQVTALLRRPLELQDSRLVQQIVDFDQLERHAAAFRADDLFCCLGTTIKKAGSQEAFRRVDFEYPLTMGRLAKAQGVKQYLIVTATGANPRSRFFYNRVKGEVEQALADLQLEGLQIFRPSLLLGQRQEPRPGEAVAALLGRLVAPALVGPLRRYRPIPAAAVAWAMVRVAHQRLPGRRIYESEAIAAIGG